MTFPYCLSAPPDSVLWLVIRAMAFADMRNAFAEEASFHIKARQHYGASLASMREIARNEESLPNDQVLAALLFIDCFEVWHPDNGLLSPCVSGSLMVIDHISWPRLET